MPVSQRTALLLLGAALLLPAGEPRGQQSQNPSPMVEHTRRHPRLAPREAPGRREPLLTGTLFIPEKSRAARQAELFVHFHGAPWIAEAAVAGQKQAVLISLQLGSGSGTYARPFQDAELFGRLLSQAETTSGMRFTSLTLTAWSAGYGAIRAILGVPEYYRRADRVLLIDGLHTGYRSGKPGPLESEIETESLEIFLRFARDAAEGRKRMLLVHTEIFPGTFASTTETADFLLRQLQLVRRPVLRWGPMGSQQIGEARRGNFHLMNFAGNTAPDHVDLLHALPEWVRMLRK